MGVVWLQFTLVFEISSSVQLKLNSLSPAEINIIEKLFVQSLFTASHVKIYQSLPKIHQQIGFLYI